MQQIKMIEFSRRDALLKRVVRVGLLEKMTLKQRQERVRRQVVWMCPGRSPLLREDRRHKGSEAGN